MRYTAYLLIACWVTSASAAIVWNYDSPLTVTENVTETAAGDFEYDYSFVNEDIAPITAFGIYTTFSAYPQTTFTGLDPTWNVPDSWPVHLVNPVADGRNLDPDIIRVFYTENCLDLVQCTVCPAETAIQPGQAVAGFSFTASVHNTSPKYYFYSTTDSGYPSYTRRYAAVGTTVPEPATLTFLALAAIPLMRRRN
jgi:hypothetical protein